MNFFKCFKRATFIQVTLVAILLTRTALTQAAIISFVDTYYFSDSVSGGVVVWQCPDGFGGHCKKAILV